MTLLALDYGEKRIGVAVTDETGTFAKPLDYLPNKSEVRKITVKEFPKGTPQDIIQKARKDEKQNCKLEWQKLCNKLLHLINCYYPDKLIVGIPTTTNPETGEIVIGSQAKKVKTFARQFETCLKQHKILLPIEFVEESMSSQIAIQNLRQQGITTSGKIKERIDSESAKVLLEEYISQNKNNVKYGS